MSWTNQDAFVKCPFYKRDYEKTIICEGAKEKQETKLEFAKRDDKRNYKQTYCDAAYSKCIYCRMLNSKYC